jgi:ArsR family transcriptional regulator, lead/cadmium/zinc/bismuth-responsive transcriptional repressor
VLQLEHESEIEGCTAETHGRRTGELSPAPHESCERAAAIFRAMGDVNRLRLLSLLAKSEMCVTELTVALNDNLPAISQRLKLLRAERLVSPRRKGKHIFYSLADNHIAELVANGLAHGDEPLNLP